MTAERYTALKQQLHHPQPTVIANWPEYIHPHTPLEDEEWLTPNINNLEAFMRQFTFHQRGLFAIAAYEIVYPEAASDPAYVDYRETLNRDLVQEGFELMRAWQDGEVSNTKLRKWIDYRTLPAGDIGFIVRKTIGGLRKGINASYFSEELFDHYIRFRYNDNLNSSDEGTERETRWRSSRGMNMPYTPEYIGEASKFLGEWWARCKCKLAFANATTAVLE